MTTQWIRRRGSKERGFRYVNASGRSIGKGAVRERIDSLRVPPAWSDVHIAASDRSAIQAWGYDVKGRKQYRYHPRAVARGDLRKYYRVRQLGRDLPLVRERVLADFRAQRGFTRERVSAAVLRLIGEGFLRVGGERYARENKTFGITTLRKSHAKVSGDAVFFSYAGKRGIEQRQVIVSADLARFVTRLKETPGSRLFRYRDRDGWHNLGAHQVNEYLRDVTGFPYSAKDFRTWGGTLRAATVLAELGPPASAREGPKNVALAMRLVASELGNTPTICRKSYVHPVVISKYLEGETLTVRSAAGSRSRKAGGHSPEEKALLAFLKRNFPERRARRRSRKEGTG
jgi:DNA topoisomerase I